MSHMLTNRIMSFRGDAKGGKGATGTGQRDGAERRESKRTVQEVQEIFSASAHDQRYFSRG